MLLKVVIIISALVCVIIFFFINSIMRQHKAVTKWQQARIAAEISTLEEERKRIAGDLHDELGPMLSAIKMQINHVEPEDKAEDALLKKSSDQIDGVIQRFREISYDLLPNTLVRKGFAKATEEYINRLKELHPLSIQFSTVPFAFAPEKEVNMYRIIQEIIQNTIKHAKATTLVIAISQGSKSILLRTQDDGVGFSYTEKTSQPKGVGLLSLQSRAELLGGQLLVNTQPGSGAAFLIEIPV